VAVKRKGTKKARTNVGWEAAPLELTRRCSFMQIYGDTGTGRTTLALTAPGPIALIHASEKLEGIVQPVAAEKDIRLYNFGGVFSGDAQTIATQASEAMADLKSAWDDALGWARTVVMDTHTEAWELLRLARFGTLTPKGTVAALYGPVNAEWKSIWKAFRRQDTCNFIAIGQIRERYRKDKPTGVMEQAGQKDMPYYADVIVRTSRNSGSFVGTVEKAWWNAHIEGLEVEDEMLDYATILGLVTETDSEEWL
jgi:hypothetical protein